MATKSQPADPVDSPYSAANLKNLPTAPTPELQAFWKARDEENRARFGVAPKRRVVGFLWKDR